MIPEIAAGTTTFVDTCMRVDAERVGAVAQVTRHGSHGVLGDGADGRNEHHAHDQPGGERVEGPDVHADVAEQRRDEREREEAVDDRRDTGEHLERRLQDRARAHPRRTRSGRSRCRGRTECRRGTRSRVTSSVPATSSHDTEATTARRAASTRVPVTKSTIDTSRKNSIAGSKSATHDPERRQDGDERAEGEDALDDVLAPAPALGAEPDRPRAGELRCRHVR